MVNDLDDDGPSSLAASEFSDDSTTWPLRWTRLLLSTFVSTSYLYNKLGSIGLEFRLDLVIMSTASRITLGTTILSTIGIIIFVHRSQKVEQAVCQIHLDSGPQANIFVILGYA